MLNRWWSPIWQIVFQKGAPQSVQPGFFYISFKRFLTISFCICNVQFYQPSYITNVFQKNPNALSLSIHRSCFRSSEVAASSYFWFQRMLSNTFNSFGVWVHPQWPLMVGKMGKSFLFEDFLLCIFKAKTYTALSNKEQISIPIPTRWPGSWIIGTLHI